MARAVPTSPKPQRILVVDDDLDIAQSLAILLREMGHDVDFAINGYAALDIARRFKPEIAFLDLILPDVNGWKLARQLRKLPGLEKVRILSVSALAGDEDVRRSLEAGCERHIVKPLDFAEVEHIVGRTGR